MVTEEKTWNNETVLSREDIIILDKILDEARIGCDDANNLHCMGADELLARQRTFHHIAQLLLHGEFDVKTIENMASDFNQGYLKALKDLDFLNK